MKIINDNFLLKEEDLFLEGLNTDREEKGTGRGIFQNNDKNFHI